MNGNGDARNNDFSNHNDSQTTNHIYLHPGPNQGEFDNWMRKIWDADSGQCIWRDR